MTKSELIQTLAEKANVEKAIVRDLLVAIQEEVIEAVKPRGTGEFTLPGIMKIGTKHIPASKGGKKIISPFTGEPMITKDKPARTRVKARLLSPIKKAANPHLVRERPARGTEKRGTVRRPARVERPRRASNEW
jgi:nucleoid DNA-binding protein